MIKRIWHGRTTPENAGPYIDVLIGTVIPGIEAQSIPGYLGIEVLRRELSAEVEFTTIMTFRKLEDVIAFQGRDYERSHVPDAAQEVLKSWDKTATHYELVTARDAAGNAR